MEAWDNRFAGIAVQYDDRAVHVRSDETLEAYLAAPGNGSLALADHVLAAYRARFGKPLQISRHSLAIEVLAHVYAENMAEVALRLAENMPGHVLTGLQRLMERLIDHVEVIDCGEGSVDGNRFVWDALAPFHRLVYAACGQNA